MKMSTVGNRIRTLRRERKYSQPELAKKAGVGQSTISDLENDKKSTSAENMEAIARALGTSSQFLLTGVNLKIEEFNQNNQKNSDTTTTDLINQKYGVYQDMVEVTYFEEISFACGSGAFVEAMEREAKKFLVSKQALESRNISEKSCVVLVASGNSMEPTIKDKDLVYVDQERKNIKDGKVFAICHGGLFKFKRLYQLPMGGVRIVSDNNDEYPEERLTAQDIIDQQFEVLGWAWSWQSMESW